jgi:iron complex outermembrane receptor protein
MNKKTTLSLAIAMALGTQVASAQLLEEVIVTAQKREQSLQDVGIAVSAFNGEQIQQLGWNSSDDIMPLRYRA